MVLRPVHGQLGRQQRLVGRTGHWSPRLLLELLFEVGIGRSEGMVAAAAAAAAGEQPKVSPLENRWRCLPKTMEGKRVEGRRRWHRWRRGDSGSFVFVQGAREGVSKCCKCKRGRMAGCQKSGRIWSKLISQEVVFWQGMGWGIGREMTRKGEAYFPEEINDISLGVAKIILIILPKADEHGHWHHFRISRKYIISSLAWFWHEVAC